ncbi:hypothetical protein CSIM01_02966 [Colletotrichum simmondsii]|uniref:Uncharacterized protein n=1 Tax=Colletotrichum simmondsii TaxID=703756 RepID=A0A135RSR4_9PEZI|nr:hypothetical protein CSIM01_02966 [Colletotrichum simmondsii]
MAGTSHGRPDLMVEALRDIPKSGYLKHPSDYNTQYNNLSLFHVNCCTTPPSTSAALSLRHKISEQRIRFDATKKKKILGKMQTATAVSSLPGGAPLSSYVPRPHEIRLVRTFRRFCCPV